MENPYFRGMHSEWKSRQHLKSEGVVFINTFLALTLFAAQLPYVALASWSRRAWYRSSLRPSSLWLQESGDPNFSSACRKCRIYFLFFSQSQSVYSSSIMTLGFQNRMGRYHTHNNDMLLLTTVKSFMIFSVYGRGNWGLEIFNYMSTVSQAVTGRARAWTHLITREKNHGRETKEKSMLFSWVANCLAPHR